VIPVPTALSLSLRRHLVALRTLLVLTVALGVVYPLVVTGVAQVLFHHQADGSLVSANGGTVGSSLIGQSFTDKDGKPLPQWFQSRPSAAGKGYDALSSGASNLGPENADLIKAIRDRRAAIAAADGVDPSSVPSDALTASGSGLDPDISPAYAYQQAARVAQARGLDQARVRKLVADHVNGRGLGFLGDKTVNVLELNLALSRLT
jgi:K+-transporting ATPase ATPase C chain